MNTSYSPRRVQCVYNLSCVYMLIRLQKERITALESQLHRCKLKLAVNTDREDVVKFLLETPDKDIGYVDHLNVRLSYVLAFQMIPFV